MNTYSAFIRPLNGSIEIFFKGMNPQGQRRKGWQPQNCVSWESRQNSRCLQGAGNGGIPGQKGRLKARCQNPSRLRNPHTTRHSWNRGKRGNRKSRRIRWQCPWEAQTPPLCAQCFGAVSQEKKPTHYTDQNKGSLHWARQVQLKAGTTELKRGG